MTFIAILQKPISSQQSEWPLGKMLQKINSEGSVEKCVPSVVRGACKEPLKKTQCRCFEKGNIELPANQSQALLGLSPEKMRIKKSQAGKPVRQQD